MACGRGGLSVVALGRIVRARGNGDGVVVVVLFVVEKGARGEGAGSWKGLHACWRDSG